MSNVGIANVLFAQQFAWRIAGLAGVLVGAVWNYVVSAAFVWAPSRPKAQVSFSSAPLPKFVKIFRRTAHSSNAPRIPLLQ